MPLMFGEDDLEAMQRLRTRVRPVGPREPGQALPDAAALRRGARPLPRASAREGRTCRALLSTRASSSTSRAISPASSKAGSRLSQLQAVARRARAALLARPARRPDARRVPARRSLGPAAPPLRHDARPRDRRHGRRCPTGCARARAARSSRTSPATTSASSSAARAAGSDSVERLALRLHPLPAAAAHGRRSARRAGRAAPLRLVPSAVDIVGRADVRAVRRSAARRRRRRRDALGGERGRSVGRAPRAAGAAAGPRALGRRPAAARRGRGRASPTSRGARPRPWSPLAERVVEALCSPS